MLPKIQQWLDRDYFPQRVLLSGGVKPFDELISIASALQAESPEKILSGICPDTLVLRNEGAFKIGNKDNPDKDSARGMIRWAMQTPVKNYRIVILEDFERTGREANNALLKILEEPPPRVIFLFSTQNHHQIMETILSRMTVVRVPHDFEDFSIDEVVKNFLQSPDLIGKFRTIEDLDKEAKKKKDKQVILKFVDDLIIHARFFVQYQHYLEPLFEVQASLHRNQNTRLVLERFACQITEAPES